MDIVKVSAFAEGYYSSASYEENIFITSESYEKIKSEDLDFCICDLDGKHSEVDAEISTTPYSEEELLKTEIESNSDGESLYYELNDAFVKYGIDLDKEISEVKSYLNSLDTYVDYTAKIKKSQISKVIEFVENLKLKRERC